MRDAASAGGRRGPAGRRGLPSPVLPTSDATRHWRHWRIAPIAPCRRHYDATHVRATEACGPSPASVYRLRPHRASVVERSTRPDRVPSHAGMAARIPGYYHAPPGRCRRAAPPPCSLRPWRCLFAVVPRVLAQHLSVLLSCLRARRFAHLGLDRRGRRPPKPRRHVPLDCPVHLRPRPLAPRLVQARLTCGSCVLCEGWALGASMRFGVRHATHASGGARGSTYLQSTIPSHRGAPTRTCQRQGGTARS